MAERLPLNALQAFAVAARLESFKAAATQLHVTPGAVSRHIKQLEARLGAPLFEREPHGVRLTARGRRLADAVDDGLHRIAAGYDAAGAAAVGTTALTVSAPPSFIQQWLLPRLADFEAVHGDGEIALEATQALSDPAWGDERAQLAIRYGRGPWPGVQAIRLLDETLFPVCSPALLKQGPPLRKPADLAAHTLLHVVWHSRQAAVFPGWREWLDTAGAPEVIAPVRLSYSLIGLALDQAIAGRGVALATSVLAADRLASGVLVRPFGERHVMASPLGYDLLLPAVGEPPRRARQFIHWLMAQAERFGFSDIPQRSGGSS